MIELAEGIVAKARELLLEARTEFDGIGYRLGLSQCDVALAHAEHRGGDYEAARRRTIVTRDALRALENPRALAACERLLSMIAIDQEDASAAGKHARAALDLFEKLGDPWGILESRLLLAQGALLRGALDEATAELATCDAIDATEAEPQQHRHLVHAWLDAMKNEWVAASEAIAAAQHVFADPRKMADHAPQLVARFEAARWNEPAGSAVHAWSETLGVHRMSATGQFAATTT